MSNFLRKISRNGINRKKERKMLKQIIANQREIENMESIFKMYKDKTGEDAKTYQDAVDYLLKDSDE